jgi:transcription initiation factor IIE alpha subunit
MSEDNTDWASLLSDFECDLCGESLDECKCDEGAIEEDYDKHALDEEELDEKG